MAPPMKPSGSAGSLGLVRLWAFLPITCLILNAPSVATAQVTTDITPSGLNTQINPVGNSYDITGGTRPGGGLTLFHSFGNFSVGAGDTANFVNGVSFDSVGNPLTAGLPTSNILGRVTGGNLSQIYGTIQADPSFGSANLFLMNPSGIILGPDALLNVGGSVSFTTAQYIRLFDGVSSANFYADPASDSSANNSLLVMEPALLVDFLSPAAYGFLTTPDPNATITVEGSTLSVLQAPPDALPNSISLVGGKVVINGAPLPDGTIQKAQISASNGSILLATAASPGEFDVNTLQSLPNNPVDPASAASFTSFGSISLAPGSSIDVHDTSTVWIKGGQLVLSVNNATLNTSPGDAPADTISLGLGSAMVTANAGADPGADVQLAAAAVQLDGASIQSSTTGDGRGGHISITDAQTVHLLNGTQIVSHTSGVGDGGAISIATTNSPISSMTITGFDGTFTLSGITNPFVGLVTSGVYSTASAGGNGGHISVAAPTVTLDDGAMLATVNTGSGVGGNISVNSNTVTAGPTSAAFVISFTGFDFTSGPIDSGNGGGITIQGLSGTPASAAKDVFISNGTQISTITGGPNTGHGGDLVISSEMVHLDTGGSINSGFSGIGDGGNITLHVDELSISNSAAITSLNDSATSGQGGNITVQGLAEALNNAATKVGLSNFGNITSSSGGPDSGGHIVITSQAVQLDTVGSINSSTGNGDGGNITLHIDGLALNGDGTQITSNTSAFGRGGNITVQGLAGALNNEATDVTLSNESRISTESFSPGNGGHLAITANSLRMDNAGISSLNHDTGQGGNIILSVGNASLLSGSTIRSITDSAGEGGVVTVQGLHDTTMAESLVLSGQSGILSNALGSGRLGNIEVYAKTVTLTDTGVIQAGTRQDTGLVAGNVTVEATLVNISSGSSILSQVLAADAGQVTVTATQVTMNDGRIETSTHGIGKAGDVALNVGSLSLSNGAIINSSSTAAATGSAGSITIHGLASAANAVTITDSSLLTTAEHTGRGGSITVEATNFTLNDATISASVKDVNAADPTDSATIGTANIAVLAKSMTMKHSRMTAESLGTRNAGNISINSKTAPGKSFEMADSQINTSAALADGGNIEIYFTDSIRLTDSTITSSVGNPTKKNTVGGNLTLDPTFFIVQRSEILANAFAGTGGAIDITAGLFLADATSVIDASSTLGVSGTVQINAPINNLSSVVGRLPESLIEVQALLRAACAARLAQGETSSFVERGRDSMPAGPEALLASPYLPVASAHLSRLSSPPSGDLSDIQVRRLSGHASPTPVLIQTDHSTCSS